MNCLPVYLSICLSADRLTSHLPGVMTDMMNFTFITESAFHRVTNH